MRACEGCGCGPSDGATAWWLQVYKRDLDIHPDNGWALRGLADALEAQKKLTEARRVALHGCLIWPKSKHADPDASASYQRHISVMSLWEGCIADASAVAALASCIVCLASLNSAAL